MSDEKRQDEMRLSLGPARRLRLITHHSPLITLLLALPAAAQPPLWQPQADFYKAVGPAIKVAWAVEPTTVPADGVLTATLTVTGATNPHEVVRPDLRKLPAFAERFQIEDVPGTPPAADAKAVTFAYRLRPRSADVTAVPSLRFAYVSPNAPPNKRERTSYAKEVPVTVAPAAAPPPAAAVPLDAPDFLFAVPTGPRLLAAPAFVPSGWWWVAAGVAGPLLAGGWLLAWRRRWPDAVKVARARRSRAARRALDAVRRAARQPDPAAAVADAVREYLAARVPLPPGSITPADVGDALTAAGLSDARVRDGVALLRGCDAARFAPHPPPGRSLTADAERLIAALEADA